MEQPREIVPQFIQKLQAMMRDYPQTINWGNQGQQFVILDQAYFGQTVLPQFFKHGKFESFVRQLNMYGFHKICRNKNTINFRNKYFFKGNQHNFHLIKRRKKDIEQANQQANHYQCQFVKLVSEKYDKEHPQFSPIISQIFKFKAGTTKTMQKLKKTMEELNREINERKSKTIKPMISQIKEMISLIDDSNKKLQYKVTQMTDTIKQQEKQEQCIVKQEDCQAEKTFTAPQIIPHQPQMNNTGYTMHGPTFFGNQLFHPHPGAILNVSSFCSFNSVTNFIS